MHIKKCLKTILLSSFLCVSFANTLTAEEAKGPRMVLKELLHDFGTVKEGKILEHSFKVFNQGDQTLEILQVRAG